MKARAISFCAAVLFFLSLAGVPAAEVLEKDMKVGNAVIPKGAEVGYYRNSRKLAWVHTKRPLSYEGMTCAANCNLELYESGKIKKIRLTSQTKIDGIVCAANYLVELYENGKIQLAALAESATISGIRVNSRDFVGFTEDGKLAYLMIQKPVEIKGKKYSPPCEIFLDGKGNVIETKRMADGFNYY